MFWAWGSIYQLAEYTFEEKSKVLQIFSYLICIQHGLREGKAQHNYTKQIISLALS